MTQNVEGNENDPVEINTNVIEKRESQDQA